MPVETAIEDERIDQEALPEERIEHAVSGLPKLALGDVTLSLQNFHNADEIKPARTLGEQEVYWRVARKDGADAEQYEDVGRGSDLGQAFIDALSKARTLETAKTKPILSLKLEDGREATFTELKDYSPKIAPSQETYEIPDFVEEISDQQNPGGSFTYEKTIGQEGWDGQIFSFVSDYLTSEPAGIRLVESLKINALDSLTPEQAVKLSLAVVQNLSKYSRDAIGNPDGDAADEKTAMQLLQEGREHKADPNWVGNGVCRNVASNVKAVFEALKFHQQDLSMLRNTYVLYGASSGEGYNNKRGEAGLIYEKSRPGHAWNTFVTVDRSGSASMTIVDATWALERDPDTALEHMDYTIPRMATIARELFHKSDDKITGFLDMNQYYNRLMQHGVKYYGGRDTAKYKQLEKFVASEYIASADTVLATGKAEGLPEPLGEVSRAIYNLAEELDLTEVRTLHQMTKTGMLTDSSFRGVLKRYVNGRHNSRDRTLVDQDDTLQSAIIDALGETETKKLAEEYISFRTRVRELTPDLLPPFDPETNPKDAEEMRRLVSGTNIAGASPQAIADDIERKLRKAAGGNDELYVRMTNGLSLYDEVKNYRQLDAAIEAENR